FQVAESIGSDDDLDERTSEPKVEFEQQNSRNDEVFKSAEEPKKPQEDAQKTVEDGVAKVTIDEKPKEEPVATRRPKEQQHKMTDSEINDGLRLPEV
ncbi:hypothetical protein MAR_012537, partial [Mya arenaria]